jgi:pyruvate dehydrogenase (quinone)
MLIPIPPSITVEMAKGFSLYMFKAVIDERGENPFARANLWE